MSEETMFAGVLRDGDITELENTLIENGMKADGEADRSHEVYRLHWDSTTYEVFVESDLTLEDYKEDTHPDDWQNFLEWSEPMIGKTVTWINPTMEGGGVAMMRPGLIDMLRKRGVDAHWGVMRPFNEYEIAEYGNPFDFTKLMHIISQRTEEPGQVITDHGKLLHRLWSNVNYDVMGKQPYILEADEVVIDDPQPVHFIRKIRRDNPNAKITWRNHIDTDGDLMSDPTTPQGEVAQYLYDSGLLEVDAAIVHPEPRFMHHPLRERTFPMPATISPRDDMNKELTEAEIKTGLLAINLQITNINKEMREQGRFDDEMQLLDPNRDRIMLIARYDEAKGMDKMMEFGKRIRERVVRNRAEHGIPDAEPPQIVILGNGSVDDTSGIKILERMRALRRNSYSDIKDDIIVARLKHNYEAINASMYRYGKGALLGAQMSDAEGLETRISDFIKHGVPMFISNRGAMHTQVIPGESGFILDYDAQDFDFDRAAEIAADLIIYPELYEAQSQATKRAYEMYNGREFTLSANVIRWLRIFNILENSDGPVRGDWLWKMSEMAGLKAPLQSPAKTLGTLATATTN